MKKHSALQEFRSSLLITILFTMVLWIVWFCDFFLNLDLPRFGIRPHDVVGLRGIIFSPFIHDNTGPWHLLSNTLPFMVLFFVLLNAYRQLAILVLVMIHLLTGLSVWLFATPGTTHVGISGIIYGIAAFLVGSGLFRRDLVSISIAVLVTFLYGGMVEGFARQPGVSWESHICGAVVGFFLSFNLRHFNRNGEQENQTEEAADERHFFERHP